MRKWRAGIALLLCAALCMGSVSAAMPDTEAVPTAVTDSAPVEADREYTDTEEASVSAQPEPEAVVSTQPEPEAETDASAQPEPEPEADVSAQPEPEAEADVSAQPEPEAAVSAQPEPEAVVSAQSEPEEQPAEMATEPATIKEVSSVLQMVDFIQENWDDNCFNCAEVDVASNTVTVDGKDSSFAQTFSVPEDTAEQLLESSKETTDYLTSEGYDVGSDAGSAILTVTSPYQLKRLMVYTDETLSDTYGATDVLHLSAMDEYLLQFDTISDTEAAYQTLSAQYGQDSISIDTLTTLAADDQDSTSTEPDSWGTSYMGLDQMTQDLIDHGITDTTTVAILDTGIDASNSYFSNRISSASCSMTPTYSSFADESTSDIMDYAATGHGTHVAGIVSQSTPDNVQLLIIRVYSTNGKSSSTSIISLAMQYALEQNASVINFSSGWTNPSTNVTTALDPVLKQIHEAGVPFCTAAGNGDANYTPVDVSTNYPANSPYTITIAALKANNSIAEYSNYGDEIDFSAPGSGIVSARVGGGTKAMSGTSMASPHVAAACALIKLIHPNYTVEEVYNTLIDYSVDLGDTGKDTTYGNGYINLFDYAVDELGCVHHVAGSRVIVTAATCSKPGSYKQSCTRCGELLDTGAIPATHNLEDGAVISAVPDLPATGSAQTPAVTVQDDSGTTLTAGTDYTLSYRDNIYSGDATITVIGTGTYSGTITQTFHILPCSEHQTERTISQQPTCSKPGTAVIRCSICGKLIDTETLPATGNLKDGAVISTSASVTYTGAACKPAVTVKNDLGAVLTAGTDYTVSYKNNTLIGTATVSVTGINKYNGTLSKSFSIQGAASALKTVTNHNPGLYLSWTSANRASSYVISRKITGGKWVNLTRVTTNSYTDTSARSGISYSYRIISYFPNTTSTSVSNIVSRLRLASPSLTSLNNNNNGFRLNWSAVSGASSYRVYRKSPGGNWKQVAAVSGVNYLDKSAVSGKTYLYTVRAVYSSVLSSYNGNGIRSIRLASPKLTGLSNYNDGLHLSWSAVSGASRYNIYRKTPGGSWKKIAAVSGVNYLDKSAVSGKTYLYTVRALCGSVLSSYNGSGIRSIRLASPKLTAKSGSRVKLSWKKVSGATRYYIYQRTSGGKWKRIATVSGSKTSYKVPTSKTKKRKTYYYTIRAYSTSASISSSYYKGKKAVRR